jgi:4-aminobutyrate aminotransferase-like enzyme
MKTTRLWQIAAGLILGWTLHQDTVVRLAPPLIISSTEIDQAVSLMQAVLRKSNQYS